MRDYLLNILNYLSETDKYKNKELIENAIKILSNMTIIKSEVINSPGGVRLEISESNYSIYYTYCGTPKRSKLSKYIEYYMEALGEEELQKNSKAINLISELFGTELAKERKVNITIVEGDEIIKAYNTVAIKSCLNYQAGTQLFANNPDKIKCAIITNKNGEITARALIWIDDDNQMFMDRIYPNDFPNKEAFYELARKNNMLYRTNHSVEANPIKMRNYVPADIAPNNPKKDSSVTLIAEDMYIPYLDTYQFGRQTYKNKRKSIVLTPYWGVNTEFLAIGSKGVAHIHRKCLSCRETKNVADMHHGICRNCHNQYYLHNDGNRVAVKNTQKLHKGFFRAIFNPNEETSSQCLRYDVILKDYFPNSNFYEIKITFHDKNKKEKTIKVMTAAKKSELDKIKKQLSEEYNITILNIQSQ